MGALIRAFDWSTTPLGPIDNWSLSLRMMVNFLLANRFPLLLWWGPDYISIYNDPYRPVLGDKHPWALGKPVSECWSEIWGVLKPLIDAPFSGGPPTWIEDFELHIHRKGFTEETHFTVAYSPVPDESAPSGTGGVLATVHEITEKVIGERRVGILRDLGTRGVEPHTAAEACMTAATALTAHQKDIPFALFYLVEPDGQRARLAASSGISVSTGIAPSVIHLDDANGDVQTWPLAAAQRTEEMQIVENLSSQFSDVPVGPGSDPPHTAVVLPIRSNMAHQLAGFFVAGVSAHIGLDEAHKNFLQLSTSQIATAIANARAFEEERKRAEALAEIDRAKTAFFSNVSHEFRTPLTLMLGPLERLLAKGGDVAPEDYDQIATAHRNSLRLLRLVNSLLDFSRIEAGRINATFVPTDLSVLTAELASNFRSAMEAAGLKLIVDCEPLRQPVYVDREMWEKIVLNLLSNAFKFTFEGSITVRLRDSGGHAVLTIADTGTGIPESELPRIFERFHRVEGARGRSFEGSGIGLALIQELTKLHAGSVSATSRVGEGTVFTVALLFGVAHLPKERIGNMLASPSQATHQEPFTAEALSWLHSHGEASAPAEQLPDSKKRGRVLIADDNADMREHVARVLGPDYDLMTAAHGHEALKLIRESPPDVLLTDIMMPRLDGFALLHEVRNNPSTQTLPVIFLSARAGEEARIEGIEAGADDYLVKPFTANELRARVGTHVRMALARKDAERKLRESEEQLRRITDTLPVLVSDIDDQFRYRFVNKTYMDWFGSSQETILGSLVSDVLGEDAFRALRPYMERALAGETVTFESRIPYREGGPRDIQATYLPHSTPDSRGFVALVEDISERKRAEQALRESDNRFRVMADTAPAMLWVSNPDASAVFLSRGWYEYTGQTEQEGLGLGWLEATHPEDREQAGRIFMEANERHEAFSMDYRLRRADGRYRWAIDSGRPRFAEDGEFLGFVGSVIDVHERKAAEEERAKLLRTAELLNQVGPAINSDLDPVRLTQTVTDLATQVTGAQFGALFHNVINDSGEEYLLYTLSGAPREAFAHLPMPRNTAIFGPTFRGAGVVRSADITQDQRYGKNAPFQGMPEGHLPVRSYLAAPVVSRDGRVIGGLFFGHAQTNVFTEQHEDIVKGIAGQAAIAFDNARLFKETLDKKEALSRTNEELLRANADLEQFAYSASHDLQEPIRNVAVYGEILSRRYIQALDAKGKEFLGFMVDGARRMDVLVKDLLAYTQCGKEASQAEDASAEVALARALENLATTIEETGATVSHGQLPTVSMGDVQLQQLFQNLVGNAIKYRKDGESPQVRITAERAGREWLFSVQDNGIGIDPEYHQKVFGIFKRLHNDAKYAGTGIGLAICQKIIERNGGRIWVESEGEGSGSTFYFTLPEEADER